MQYKWTNKSITATASQTRMNGPHSNRVFMSDKKSNMGQKRKDCLHYCLDCKSSGVPLSWQIRRNGTVICGHCGSSRCVSGLSARFLRFILR